MRQIASTWYSKLRCALNCHGRLRHGLVALLLCRLVPASFPQASIAMVQSQPTWGGARRCPERLTASGRSGCGSMPRKLSVHAPLKLPCASMARSAKTQTCWRTALREPTFERLVRAPRPISVDLGRSAGFGPDSADFGWSGPRRAPTSASLIFWPAVARRRPTRGVAGEACLEGSNRFTIKCLVSGAQVSWPPGGTVGRDFGRILNRALPPKSAPSRAHRLRRHRPFFLVCRRSRGQVPSKSGLVTIQSSARKTRGGDGRRLPTRSESPTSICAPALES